MSNYSLLKYKTIFTLLMLSISVAYTAHAQDTPCSAISFPIEGNTCNPITGTSTSAMPSGAIPMPSCGDYQGGDVWYQVVMPNNGLHLVLEVEGVGGFDPGIAVYSGSCNALTLVDCNSDVGGTNTASIRIDDGVLFEHIGETYWVRVWENGNDNNGDFNICAYAKEAPITGNVSVCGDNYLGGDRCADAILLSGEDLNNYCGNTGGYDAYPTSLPGDCGQIENNTWLAFIPSSETVSLEFESSNCISQGTGISGGLQVRVLTTDDCNTFVNVSGNCVDQNVEGTASWSSDGLEIGRVHYISIDAFAGSYCDYEIRVIEGVENIDVTVSESSICGGGSTNLSAIGLGVGPYTYSWSPVEGLDNPNSQNPVASPSSTTTYTVTVSDDSGVVGTKSTTIQVLPPAPTTVDITGSTEICEGTSNLTYEAVAADATIYNWTITGTGATINGASNEATANVSWGASGGELCVEVSSTCAVGTPVQKCITISTSQSVDFSVENPPVSCTPSTVNLSQLPLTIPVAAGAPSFHYTEEAAHDGWPIINPPVVDVTGTYWIRVQTGTDCYEVEPVFVEIQDVDVQVSESPAVCEPSQIDLDAQIFVTENGWGPGTKTYYRDSLDAVNSTNELPSSVVNEGGIYWLRFETQYGCFDVEPIMVNIMKNPDIEILQQPAICSGASVDIATLSYTDNNSADITSITYYDNLSFAQFGLTTLALTNTVVSTTGSYYMRAETVTGCEQIVEIIVSEAVKPEGKIRGGGFVCSGSEASVIFEFDGIAPFDVVYSNGTTDIILSGIENNHLELVEVTEDTDFSLVSFIDATGCAGDVIGNDVSVVVYDVSTASISGDQTACGNAGNDLVFNFTGNGPFDVVYTDGTDEFTLNGIGDGYRETVSVDENKTFTLVSFIDDNGCNGTVDGSATITHYPELVVTHIDEVCNAAVTGYTVTFDIEGGDLATYEVVGAGTLTGASFVSDLIPSGVAYSFTIKDQASGCQEVVITGSKNCSCSTFAGTMDLSQEIDVCEGDDASVVGLHQGDEVLGQGEVLAYVLHDNAGATLGDIESINQSGIFEAPVGITYGETYYISAIAGPALGTSIIDLAHNCTVISAGVPVRFHEEPEVIIEGASEICRGDIASITFKLIGGTPPFDIVYTDGTDNYTFEDVFLDGESTAQLDVTPLVGTSYSIVSVVDKLGAGCPGTGSGLAQVTILESPYAQNVNFVCNSTNDAYQVVFNIASGDAATYVVNGNGNYDATTNTFTSNLIPTGQAYSFEITDGNNCSSNLVEGIHVCDCETEAVEMENTLIEVCDDVLAEATYVGSPTLDGNDVMGFVLHTGPAGQFGDILLTSTTPAFAYDDVLTYNQIYFISAIVGNDDGTGFPVLDPALDPCLSTAVPGQPVIFHAVPKLDLLGDTTICGGTTQDLLFDFSVDGVYNVTYTDGTSTYELLGIGDGHTVTVAPEEETVYSLVSVFNTEGTGCEGDVFYGNHDITIGVIERPRAVNMSTTCNEAGTRYTISFEIEGGDATAYNVTGSPGTLTGNVFTSEELLSGLPYFFSITDGITCDPVEITNTIRCNCTPDILPEITLSKNISCHGFDDGRLKVSPQNGVAPYTYEWSNGQFGEVSTDLALGWHHVTMTDGNGCLSVDSFFLNQPTPITAEYLITDVTCFGRNDGRVEFLNIYGGAGDYEFRFEESISNIGYEYFGMTAGEYIAVLTDRNGCVVRDTVTVVEPDSITVSLGEDQTILLGDSIQLTADFNQAIESFYWLASSDLEVPDSNDYIEYVTPLETTTFRVHAVNEFGCGGVGEVQIFVDRTLPAYVPSAFSPNRDGINDKLRIYLGKGVARVISFEVYNRWGGQMYSQTDINPVAENWGWDGRYESEIAPVGVYIYNAVVELQNGVVRVLSGDVTLMR